MNSNPETAQICRQYFRIPLFSAVVFVETSKDQQIWTVFISRMTLPWFAGWAEYRSQIMQKKLQSPCSSLAVVHIILIERTGIRLPSVDQRPRFKMKRRNNFRNQYGGSNEDSGSTPAPQLVQKGTGHNQTDSHL